MSITSPQAAQFSNAGLRPFSNLLAQAYDAATILLNWWNANGGAGILPPATVTPTPGTAGTMAAGLKAYKVSALNALGETLCSAEATCTTVGSTGSVSVAWSAVAGATSFNIYGRTSGAELLIGNSAASPFVDTGAVTPAGGQPVSNTTGLIPNDSEVLVDGSATDGRPQLTGAKCNNIVSRALDIKNFCEGSATVATNDGSKTILNTILASATNPSSGISGL